MWQFPSAGQAAMNINIAPMAFTLRKRLLGLLNSVNCNGQRAYSTAHLIGSGSPLSIFSSWAVSWSVQQTRMKYYLGTSADAKEQVSTCDVDFGVVGDGLSDQWYARMPDAGLMPVIAYALVPGTCHILISYNC